jgi:hypothetical protein
MHVSETTKERLPAVLSLLVGCVGLAWIPMIVQESDAQVPSSADAAVPAMSGPTPIEPAPAPGRTDDEPRPPLDVLSERG